MQQRIHISLGGQLVSDQQKRVSDAEFIVTLPKPMKISKISLLQFQMLNVLSNIHADNNTFYYVHLGVNKQVEIPQNSYTLGTLITKLSDLLTAQSSISVTHQVVENRLQLTFSAPITFVNGIDAIWKRLGFSSAVNTSFSLSKALHIADNIFNLAQTPTVYMQIKNCGFIGDIIQNQHFAIPNLSSYGSYISYVAQKADDQQTISGDPITLNQLRFTLFDYDGHQLHSGFADNSNAPLTLVLDIA